MEDQLGKLLRAGPAAASPRQEPEEALLSDQQRRLVESVFRGCDLVLRAEELPPSPPQTPPPAQPPPGEHPSRRHFRDNAYLDQVLSWAYTPSSET